ncbi:MAG: hypothetical protein NTV99_12590 [Deltaproteobacteria bacterium]|nr:hypothetical protein [Deltaproteobacteria bacterium]
MRTRRVFLATLLPVILIFFYSTNLKATNESGCVNCHTSVDLLKKLCKVPALGGGEGEG